MSTRPLDDPAILSAMRAYLDACATADRAAGEDEIMTSSEAKSMAGMMLRQRLTEAGWHAPTSQRTNT